MNALYFNDILRKTSPSTDGVKELTRIAECANSVMES